jgi:Uma2 family endonuclease
LAPDVLVARVDDHPRSSYDVEREGVPPSFVLEVISPESWNRDLNTKPERYEVMGVTEYALYDPGTPEGRLLLDPPLQGYRREPQRDEFTGWQADEQGRLYSEVLSLWLVVHEGALRAQRLDGSLVPTLEESERARDAERRMRDEERRLREQAEAEVARLRAELERRARKT